jgi:hypothetical protein
MIASTVVAAPAVVLEVMSILPFSRHVARAVD